MRNNHRPININPLSIKLPIGALVSITHRISGIIVFLLIPVLLWLFQKSLVSPEGLNQIRDHFDHLGLQWLVWILLAGLSFHLLAGIRHLLMDVHIGDSLIWGRRSAKWVIAGTLAVVLGLAYWIWG